MKEAKSLGIERYSNILILTGSGVSAASGIPTFRGPDGILEPGVEWVSDAKNLPDSLPGLWNVYGEIRRCSLLAHPNPAHKAIAEIQRRWDGVLSISLATQNVDGLHQRAGSVDVIELHGNVHRSCCMNPDCTLAPFEDTSIPEDVIPLCMNCGSTLRPDIILFSEELPIDALWKVKHLLRKCDLFIAIGTSGSVWPAANFVNSAAYIGARTVLVNKTPMEVHNPNFQEEYIGNAEDLLPMLFGLCD